MNIVKTVFLGLILSIGVIGCSGVTFAPAPTNQPIPETFTNRAVYPAGVADYEFQDLVGGVLLIKANARPMRIGMIRPTGYVDKVIPIEESNSYYRSRVQKGAELQGAYLAFAADFSADDMAELTLVDTARAAIVFSNEDIWNDIRSKAVEWVQNNPKQSGESSQRLWLKSVVLTRRIYHTHTKISANASGQVGEVTGVESGVYKKSESDNRSVIIGFEAFDIDELAKQAVREPQSFVFSESEVNNLIADTKYVGLVEGEILFK